MEVIDVPRKDPNILVIEIDKRTPWYALFEELERNLIMDTLQANGHKIGEAADTLKINRTTLHEKVKKLGIPRRKYFKNTLRKE
jgi:DNA-binding NtrC family response regulator